MADLSEIGAKIRESRKRLRLTQAALAEKSGVSRARLEALENARLADIGFKNVRRLLNAIGLDLSVVPFNRRRPTLEELLAENDEIDRAAAQSRRSQRPRSLTR